ncbi:Glutamate receptor ionotropic, kainate 1 [Homalodisca vitripennis]|nr:Glutamate receptor ionotropic, kainate 1 [Homalodisca vitripennis]
MCKLSGIQLTGLKRVGKSRSLVASVTAPSHEKLHEIVKEDENFTGIAKFKDFCISLLKWIATQVGFHYAIRLVPDPHEMCLLSRRQRRADQGVASMTVNYARESVIDFTKPFMNLGIGILFKVCQPLDLLFSTSPYLILTHFTRLGILIKFITSCQLSLRSDSLTLNITSSYIANIDAFPHCTSDDYPYRERG